MTVDAYKFREKAAQPGAPLVFTFHGTGGDENQFFGLAEEIWPLASLISPRGDVSEHGALRFFRRKAEGLYDFEDLERRRLSMAGFVRSHKERAAPSRTNTRRYNIWIWDSQRRSRPLSLTPAAQFRPDRVAFRFSGASCAPRKAGSISWPDANGNMATWFTSDFWAYRPV